MTLIMPEMCLRVSKRPKIKKNKRRVIKKRVFDYENVNFDLC